MRLVEGHLLLTNKTERYGKGRGGALSTWLQEVQRSKRRLYQ